MRTHYDNLKVAENAPDEVIRAAYKALSLRYHPDRNAGNPDSHRVMQIINDAYAVLSDPVQRSQYDRTLARLKAAQVQPQQTPNAPTDRPSVPIPRRAWWRALLAVLLWDIRVTILAGFMAWAGISSLFEVKKPHIPYSPTPPAQSQGTRVNHPPSTYLPTKPAYVRPALAPNGYSWPSHASYLTGTRQTDAGGHSSVTVDNTRNSSDVYLKLVFLREKAYPVRVCFIPAFSQFTFQGVAAGRYDVRYQDLSTGGLSKTEEFSLQETKSFNGTEYSNLTLTLYKVTNGNMHTETIDESEF